MERIWQNHGLVEAVHQKLVTGQRGDEAEKQNKRPWVTLEELEWSATQLGEGAYSTPIAQLFIVQL